MTPIRTTCPKFSPASDPIGSLATWLAGVQNFISLQRVTDLEDQKRVLFSLIDINAQYRLGERLLPNSTFVESHPGKRRWATAPPPSHPGKRRWAPTPSSSYPGKRRRALMPYSSHPDKRQKGKRRREPTLPSSPPPPPTGPPVRVTNTMGVYHS